MIAAITIWIIGAGVTLGMTCVFEPAKGMLQILLVLWACLILWPVGLGVMLAQYYGADKTRQIGRKGNHANNREG